MYGSVCVTAVERSDIQLLSIKISNLNGCNEPAFRLHANCLRGDLIIQAVTMDFGSQSPRVMKHGSKCQELGL